MPFTFAHPAIVLPFAYLPRRYYSLTGLVVGSMSPDFEYFVRMRILSLHSHSLVGLFAFDIPITIIVAFLFHNCIKIWLFDNLPNFLSSKFVSYKNFDWSIYIKTNWGVILISTFIGAVSHIVWDGFTHKSGYFVANLPFLSHSTQIFTKSGVFNYQILQHISSLVGAIVIFWAISQMPSVQITTKISWKYWFSVAAISFLMIIVRMLIGNIGVAQIGHIIATSIAAVFVAMILTPIVLKNE